jgi:hypothetical protein
VQARTRKKLPPALKWTLWILLVQFILFNISASIYAYRLTYLYNDTSLKNSKSTNVLAKTWRLFTGPRFIKAPPGREPDPPFENLNFTTRDGTSIHGWYIKTDSASRGTVLMFHGITAQKSQMLTEASAFREMGLNVLMIDFRGHGRSGGNTSTLGFSEAEEVAMAWEHVKKMGEENIYLYGVSMGAVTVARAISTLRLSPKAVILEMPFESLRSHLRARARAFGFPGFPEKPFGFLVGTWIGWERGYKGGAHNTVRYVKNIHCPVLLQWGDKDEYVEEKETTNIYRAIAAADKKIVIYEGAVHESLLLADPLKWKSSVQTFIYGSPQAYPAE